MDQTIRNFAILSHIDHGKSTLADRFLEITNTVSKEKMRPQYLDMMDLERERGITIKMQPVRMIYTLNSKKYIFNLIDTPGHADFSYEVSRSLAAVEGVILLVDAVKGIQAQTLVNLELARKENLVIIPVINKIDLVNARIEEVSRELSDVLGVKEEEIIKISAKYGTNVKELLLALIEKIPPPKSADFFDSPLKEKKALKALIFDSKYDPYKGIITYIRLFEGELKPGDKIYLIAAKTEGEAEEVGFFQPDLTPQKKLLPGEIGYVATGIKKAEKVLVGDTITNLDSKEIAPLPGYRNPKSVVFLSVYSEEQNSFKSLNSALSKLKLTDPSLIFIPEFKEALGRGFRCGFLGALHAEIILERLHREFNLKLIVSAPSVVFKIIDKNNKEILIRSPADWPDPSQIKESQEPWVELEVITPNSYLGRILELLSFFKAKEIRTKYLGAKKLLLFSQLPLRKLIAGFYDKLKSVSQGYASMNYKIIGFRKVDLVKVEILIAGKKEEALSEIVPREEAFQEGKRIVSKLKEVLPLQLFAVPLQASVGGKIIARETLKARRKDVTAPLYGGDYTRKRKLLEKQKKGKKELKEKGKIKIPTSVFFEMIKK